MLFEKPKRNLPADERKIAYKLSDPKASQPASSQLASHMRMRRQFSDSRKEATNRAVKGVY